jgi:deazaflavin-dependent oxidoreductase (nitroreductase family)
MAKTFRMSTGRSIFNVAMKTLLRWGIVPGPNLYLLTVAGRKSGRPITIPVALVVREHDKWLVSAYGTVEWVRNVRAAGRVRIWRGRECQTLQTKELGPEEAAPILLQYLQEQPVGSYFDVKASSPLAEFVHEAPRHPVFRLRA